MHSCKRLGIPYPRCISLSPVIPRSAAATAAPPSPPSSLPLPRGRYTGLSARGPTSHATDALSARVPTSHAMDPVAPNLVDFLPLPLPCRATARHYARVDIDSRAPPLPARRAQRRTRARAARSESSCGWATIAPPSAEHTAPGAPPPLPPRAPLPRWGPRGHVRCSCCRPARLGSAAATAAPPRPPSSLALPARRSSGGAAAGGARPWPVRSGGRPAD